MALMCPSVQLGNSGVRVSRVGLGTVKLGRSAGLKYVEPVRIPGDDEAEGLLRAARELGVMLIDTAPAYGVAEERLGVLLYRVAPREAWTLCTKAGERFEAAGNGGLGLSSYDFSPAAITASIESSLRKLGTDHLDLALLHFASSVEEEHAIIREGAALLALQRLKEAGKIRAIGASCAHVGAALDASATCDVVMLTLNSEDRSMLPAIELARQRGVGVLIKKPLASGRIAARQGLKLVLDTPGVQSAILGTTSAAHLREAVEVASGLGRG